MNCISCEGTGKSSKGICRACKGTGKQKRHTCPKCKKTCFRDYCDSCGYVTGVEVE